MVLARHPKAGARSWRGTAAMPCGPSNRRSAGREGDGLGCRGRAATADAWAGFMAGGCHRASNPLHSRREDDMAGVSRQGTLGNDVIITGNGSDTVHGDAITLTGRSRGGNDSIATRGGDDSVYGDAANLCDAAQGGSDFIWGGAGNDWLQGDSGVMLADACGGNDTLIGGGGNDTLWGDSFSLHERARGGNDILIGGSGDDLLWGDGNMPPPSVPGGATPSGGNDVLFGGFGDDRFVFTGAFGHDVIGDFAQGDDGLSIGAYPGGSLVNLGIEDVRLARIGQSTVLLVDADGTHGTITLAGFTGTLQASDFIT
ncbi:calcium-binding protein [Roseicella aerolata]|uniref:Calcium-binding protein n=1 Tax=Roseicella aerolata TaxID=2883479 RepID=A0A9X1LAI1_9PROT|nr:calcium-binding protein [Roseicella aerolata]MCB4824996.1 hypothetical protein [Roseicella aerolata]